MQLDWRVSQLAQELSLTEHQVPRVRIVLANALARWASARRGDSLDDPDSSVRDRIEALLNPRQRDRLAALLREGRLMLPGD